MIWLPLLVAMAPAAGWTTGGHDTRRTGQSEHTGPASIDVTYDVLLTEALMLNAPPAIGEDGDMLWGTWGVVTRVRDTSDPRGWDKLDGTVEALDRDLVSLWSPPALDVTPFCYDYDGREDLTWCPDGGQVSFLNGIVDSTPTLTGDGAAWVARGDGGLYEVDLENGASERVLTTWSPEDEADPDGGGGLLGSPLALPDGGVLVGSVGAGPYETHALYAVERGGGVRWRLPADTGSYPGPFWAPVALSPDGGTAYAATWAGPGFNDADEDLTLDGVLVAIDLGAADDADDTTRELWKEVPVTADGDPLYVRALAVGTDGTLYLGGLATASEVAWVVAYDADGGWLWGTSLDPDDTELVRGLALREQGGSTTAVLATTGHRASGEKQGRLHALSPATGAVDWTFDPEDEHGHGAPSGIAVGADGTAYIATQGAGGRGSVLAVDADGAVLWRYCNEGHEGAHPVITPDGDLVVGQGETLTCAMTDPLSSTCRSGATDRTVRVYYADRDRAPDGARLQLQCCRCSTSTGAAGGAPLMALLLLVRRRRSR